MDKNKGVRQVTVKYDYFYTAKSNFIVFLFWNIFNIIYISYFPKVQEEEQVGVES